jgi:hypothetical protein
MLMWYVTLFAVNTVSKSCQPKERQLDVTHTEIKGLADF